MFRINEKVRTSEDINCGPAGVIPRSTTGKIIDRGNDYVHCKFSGHTKKMFPDDQRKELDQTYAVRPQYLVPANS